MKRVACVVVAGLIAAGCGNDGESASRLSPAKAQERAELAQRAERARNCTDAQRAYFIGQQFVKRVLASPASAKFPPPTADLVSSRMNGMCNFRIAGYVDSKNAFGVTLRSWYQIDLEYLVDTKEWSLKRISM